MAQPGLPEICELARSRSLEEVAALLWTGSSDTAMFDTPLHVVSGRATEGLSFITRAMSVLPLVAARDPLARDLSPQSAAATGWRIVNLLASVAAESQELGETVEETLAGAWRARGRSAPRVLRTALILSARGEADAARVAAEVAKAGGTPYGAVVAALAVFEAAHSARAVEAISARVAARAGTAPAATPRRSTSRSASRAALQAGFSREADPAAALLLSRLPRSNDAMSLRETVESAARRGAQPNIEFALAAVEQTLALPRGSALALLVIGRSIGWLGAAIEQYAVISEAG